MPLTFLDGWDAAENHNPGFAGLSNRDEVESVLASACAGVSTNDAYARTLLTLCGTRDPRAWVVKGVHQAEDVGLVGATYHATVSVPGDGGRITFHVHFSLTVIDLARPRGISQKKWWRTPIEKRQYRQYKLDRLSYCRNGRLEFPDLYVEDVQKSLAPA